MVEGMDFVAGISAGFGLTVLLLAWIVGERLKNSPKTQAETAPEKPLEYTQFSPHQGALRMPNGGLRIVSPTFPDGEVLPALIAAENGWGAFREQTEGLTQELVSIGGCLSEIPNHGMARISCMSCLMDIMSAQHLFQIRYGVDVVMDNDRAFVCAYTQSGKVMSGGELKGWVNISQHISTKNA